MSFKQVVMDFDTINGLRDTNETVIAKILNKNPWCHHGKVWRKQKNEVVMKMFGPFLITWLN